MQVVGSCARDFDYREQRATGGGAQSEPGTHSWLRAMTHTCAPAFVRATVMASPMPRLPPVTRACWCCGVAGGVNYKYEVRVCVQSLFPWLLFVLGRAVRARPRSPQAWKGHEMKVCYAVRTSRQNETHSKSIGVRLVPSSLEASRGRRASRAFAARALS